MQKLTQTRLAVKNMFRTFGSKKVHQGISFDLREGEILGLFGSSGSGKSLILRSIIGLEKPDRGQILFEGKDIVKLSENKLIPIRIKIGYVFQNGALFDSLTVEENLSYPLQEHTQLSAKEIHHEVNEMLSLNSLNGSNHLYPSELSGGMQKRVGLARATILKPKVILFDEPTAGLDPVSTSRLVEHIKKLKANKVTGIFVSHDIPTALEISDRIAILYEGKIHTIDTVENITHSQDPLVQSFTSGSIEGKVL